MKNKWSLVYLLFPFSVLFFIGVWFRNLFFDLKILKSRSVSRPVICVGNLTTGGTGKTPWVQFICEHLEKEGRKVAIVSRGYGGHFSGIVEIQPDSDPGQYGDEPLLLKQKTHALVYAGKDRFAAVQKILSKHETHVILLDDGFQHRQLKRDFNIVLLDALAPSHHYSMLPVGRMRESFSSLRRADVLIINRCNQAGSERVEKLLSYCRPYISESQIFFSDCVFDKWSPLFDKLKSGEFTKASLSGGKTSGPDNPDFTGNLKRKKPSLICALGNPKGFLKTVYDLDINPVREFIFPDHYFWKPHDVKKIMEIMKKEKSSDLLLTAKDAVKLVRYRKEFLNCKIQLWVCSMSLGLRGKTGDLFSRISTRVASYAETV